MLDGTSKCTPELSKEDLLRLLACLQSELEARDVVIGTLKTERQGLINFKAKYGVTNFEKIRPFLVDPYEALQRDSLMNHGDNSVDKSDLRQYYDSQLAQLESLIATQRIAQEKVREQLKFMETKYIKVRGELEAEKRKHEHETAQGDVLVMLEQERERLKSEVAYEKSQNKKLEKDLNRLIHVWKEQSLLLARQKEVTVALLIERRRYLQRLSISENATNQKPRIECIDSSIQTTFYGAKIGKPMCSDKVDVGATQCDQISMLRENLEVEKACHSEVELNYERLKEGYEKLLAEVNFLRSSKLATSGDGDHDASGVTDCASTTLPSCSSTSVSTDVDVKLVEFTSSVVMPLRTKPHPPARRSSEVTNMTVPLSSHSPISWPTLTLAVNGLSADEQLANTNDVDDCTTTEVSITRNATDNGDFPVEPSSRSSTPSPPPPPPPPVQLHYPYPGMQSHLQNSHSRVPATGGTGNNEGFFSRPISSSLVSTSPYAVVRPRQPPISNPSPYASLNSGGLVHRINLPPTSVRPSAYHTPVSVNFQLTQKIVPPPFPTALVSGTETSFPTKNPPVTATAPANLGQRRKSPLPVTPQSQTQVYPLTQHQNHPFSSYSPRYHHHPRAPHRYPTGGGAGTNGSGGINAIVSPSGPVTPASHAVRTIRPHSSGPPEHVCIGGK